MVIVCDRELLFFSNQHFLFFNDAQTQETVRQCWFIAGPLSAMSPNIKTTLVIVLCWLVSAVSQWLQVRGCDMVLLLKYYALDTSLGRNVIRYHPGDDLNNELKFSSLQHFTN